MRGFWIVVVAAALTGCEGLRDMFTSRPEIAAEAAGHELKVDRLATLVNQFKGVPLSPEAAAFIANMWVDHTLFATAIARGEVVDDSATAAQVLWPEVAEAVGIKWHDSLLARRSPINPEVGDSVFQADGVRVLQHIMIRAAATADTAARKAARRKAEAALARVKGGTQFGKVAAEVSEDASKSDQGYLPPRPKGAFVTSVDSAGWALGPGEMSGVVESPYGYHIIRRPPLSEVRDRLTNYARERATAQLDSVYLDSLAISRKLRVADDAPTTMRAALTDRDAASRSDKALATYTGGALTVADYARWVAAAGPGIAAQLQVANDTALHRFALAIAQNELLLTQADSAGIHVTADEWKGMMQRYQAQVDTLRMSLDLFGSDLTDPAATLAERDRVAGIKVDAHWDRVAQSAARPRPIPTALAAVLRNQGRYKVFPAGIQAAVNEAQAARLKEQQDSLAKAPAAAPTGPAPAAAPADSAQHTP